MPKKGRQATRTTPGYTGPFKGSPQQGTLFDVRTMPKTGEEIGPRGYSLNRSRQFNDIIQKRTGFTKQSGQVGIGVKYRDRERDEPITQASNEERGTTPAVRPDQHPFGPAYLGKGHNEPVEMEEYSRREAQSPGYFSASNELAKSMGRGRSKLIDTLARSTVSPEHLKGLHDINLHPRERGVAGTYHGNENYTRIHLNVTSESGESMYREGEGPIQPEDYPPHVSQTQQRGPVHPDSEMTLLHEIGHHVSKTSGTAHSSYRTAQQQGAEEGFADAFMMKHYREDPRNIHWHGRTDPRQHSYGARGQAEEKFGSSGAREYHRTLGSENQPPTSRAMGRTLEQSAVVERHLRPMLDEPLVQEQGATSDSSGVFHEQVKGMGGTPQESAYKRAAQITHGRMGLVREGRAEQKRRWGVNRNLGRQWPS